MLKKIEEYLPNFPYVLLIITQIKKEKCPWRELDMPNEGHLK